MNRDVERLTPFWDRWLFRGGPLLQLFDGSSAGIYDREKFSESGLQLWLVEICLKGRTE